MAGPTREFWDAALCRGRHAVGPRREPSPQLARVARLRARCRPCRILVPGCGSGYEVADARRRRASRSRGWTMLAEAIARTRRMLEGREASTRRSSQADALDLAAGRAVRRGLRADLPVRAVPGPVARIRRSAAPLARAAADSYSRSSSNCCVPRRRRGRRSRARPTTATSTRCARCFRRRSGLGRSRPIRAPRTRAASPSSRSSSAGALEAGIGRRGPVLLLRR